MLYIYGFQLCDQSRASAGPPGGSVHSRLDGITSAGLPQGSDEEAGVREGASEGRRGRILVVWGEALGCHGRTLHFSPPKGGVRYALALLCSGLGLFSAMSGMGAERPDIVQHLAQKLDNGQTVEGRRLNAGTVLPPDCERGEFFLRVDTEGGS